MLDASCSSEQDSRDRGAGSGSHCQAPPFPAFTSELLFPLLSGLLLSILVVYRTGFQVFSSGSHSAH